MLQGMNEELAFPILMGRPKIEIQETKYAHIEGKTVLITGAGGSIGSEIVKQVLQSAPKLVVLLDISEYNMYEIHTTVVEAGHADKVMPVVGDIRDNQLMRLLFRTYMPELVIHAAALKHVPLMEFQLNTIEAIRTNTFGSVSLYRLSVEFGAERFVMISSDKAVNPTSLMGATKRAAEVALNREHEYAASSDPKATALFMVRFGNVFGSSGSVIPLFRRQIARGGPLTITHPDITRFFMAISEAVDLVLKASSMPAGETNIYMLDMGQPVRIFDMAVQLIRMSGYTPGRDIKIEVSGLRDGEKLFEELKYEFEAEEPTQFDFVKRLTNRQGYSNPEAEVVDLKEAVLEMNYDMCIAALRRLVPQYKVTPDEDSLLAPA